MSVGQILNSSAMQSDDGVMHFPGFSGDAAAFLLEERDIHGIGVDTLSLDIGSSTTFGVHLTVLPAGKYGIENIANLAMIKDTKAQIVVGVPRWGEGFGWTLSSSCYIKPIQSAMT